MAIYIRDEIKFKRRPDIISNNHSFEICAVEIETSCKNIIVIVCYRPPNSDIDAFNKIIRSIGEQIRTENKNVHWTGDFNINLLNADTHKRTGEFLNEFFSQSLFPAITKPTRITDYSATLIDNIFCDNSTTCLSGMLYTDISEHCPIFVMTNLESRGEGIRKSQPTFKRNLNQHNLNKFEKALEEFDWSCISQISDTEIAYDRFVEYYSKMFNDCCPLQQVRIKKCNQPKKQWMTSA